MTSQSFQKWFCLLLAPVLAFSACAGVNDPDPDPDPGPALNVEGNVRTVTDLTANGAPIYFSLTTGQAVANPAATDWDIAFAGGRQIWTNSGATAEHLKSGGQGGVWHTDKKKFADVTSKEDAITDVPFYQPYHTDAARYASGMSGGAVLGLLARSMNVMTYAGYTNENDPGAGINPGTPYAAPYLYNKKQFYFNALFMPPDFRPSLQVYIIRHGDGQHYSKFQVTEYINMPDIFSFKFENLPD
jgi:hypothetical protein